MTQFWLTFYFVCGLATGIFMAINYGFIEDTPWWRKILSYLLVLVFWPFFLLVLMFT